ncbi:hypothetical protein Tco_1463077, partial [Tanacetum coccineum]
SKEGGGEGYAVEEEGTGGGVAVEEEGDGGGGVLLDGTMKAHSKHCGKFLKNESKSTLRTHTKKYYKALKSVPEAG